MKRYRSLFILIWIMLCTSALTGQSEMEKLYEQKNLLLTEIKKSQDQIQSFTSDLSSATLQLSAIQRNINIKNDLLKQRKSEIAINKKIIKLNQIKVDSLTDMLTDLKSNFKAKANGLYVRTLKEQGKIKLVSFFGRQASLKNVYAAQYRASCMDQAVQINRETATIDSTIIIQKKLLAETEATAVLIKKEKIKFDTEHKKLKTEMSTLKSQSALIKKDLARYNKELETLETAISKVINKSSVIKFDVKLSENFSANKSLFNTPLPEGIIISTFGEQPHPLIRNVQIFNNGVDLTSRSPKVLALFGGKVISIQEIPGSGQAIIVQHGTYYTVYSKLVKTLVNIGDQVDTYQHIGDISSIVGKNVLHFELWNNQKRLDPEKWINF